MGIDERAEWQTRNTVVEVERVLLVDGNEMGIVFKWRGAWDAEMTVVLDRRVVRKHPKDRFSSEVEARSWLLTAVKTAIGEL